MSPTTERLQDLPPLQGLLRRAGVDPGTASSSCDDEHATNGHWSQWMKLSYGRPSVISSSSDLTRGPIDAGPWGKRRGLRMTIPLWLRPWLRNRRSSSRKSSRLYVTTDRSDACAYLNTSSSERPRS